MGTAETLPEAVLHFSASPQHFVRARSVHLAHDTNSDGMMQPSNLGSEKIVVFNVVRLLHAKIIPGSTQHFGHMVTAFSAESTRGETANMTGLRSVMWHQRGG